MTRCAAGYWYDKSQTTVDCVEVGDGNYSVAPMEREVCPTLNTLDGYTPTTGGSTTSDDVSDCWSTVLYAPDGGHGTGTQVCQYNTTSYAGTSCKEQFINKCDAGYYKSADDAVVCTITPKGTYSETDWLYYQDCPIYPDVEITSGEGMTNIASCLAVTPHDGGECIAHKTCSYQVASGKYDINCGTIIFESCNPGYYVDTAINPTQGIEVEKNFFGPVDINSDGFAIERKPCPEYNGVQGQTDQAASGSVSRCFAEKVTCDIANGAGEHDRCYYGENGYDNCDGYICTVTECNEGTSLVNNTCVGCEENHVCANGQQLSCSVLTNGEYTMSDYGTEDVNQCYYNCQDLVGDDTYPFATKIDGRVYKSGARTCEIAQCTDGYTLEGGECDICPKDHWCNPETENGKPQSCPDEFKYSGEESYSADNCYRFCSDLIGTDRYPHASQINGTEYKSGDNDCVITQCKSGYTLKDGECQKCPANMFCNPETENGKPQSCPNAYPYSDAGADGAEDCYRKCSELAGSDEYPTAVQMSGLDYNNGTNTCVIDTCENGYALSNNTCSNCPADSFCNSEIENGKPQECPDSYPYSDAGADGAEDCYRKCSELAGSDEYPTAVQMSGLDYNNGTNTCVIDTCESGYALSNNTCSNCPAGKYCENGKPQSCPNAYPYSDAGADGAEDCYRKCEELAGSAEYPTAVQMSGLDYNNGTNTCVIDTCESGYALSNNTCSNCPAGKYCENGKETACPNAYPYSDAGADGAEDCYRKCEEQVGTGEYPNATQIEGIDLNDGVDKCKVMDCDDGYILDEKNNSCGVCMKNHYCTDSTATPVKCPTAYPNAAPGANSIDDCYLECSGYAVEYGTAEPTNDKAYYGEKCEFSTGTSETGNPCDIVYDDARGVYVCVETSCKYDFEMVNGKCQYCARENAIEYKPNGNCVVALCVSGYHPYGQSCEENIVACDAPNAVAAERRWNDRANAYGECIITECEDGYHVAANACQLNIEVCELPHGVGERIWNTSTNKWGDCIATKCDPGYTNDPTQTGEQWQQCGRCNNMYAAYGTEIAVSSYVEECEIASCMYEGEKYVLEGNECVLKCTEKVDETGHRYWDESRKKCVHECNYDRGYINW